MTNFQIPNSFSSIPGSRRPEFSAWGFAIALSVVLYFTVGMNSGFRIGAWVLLVFSLLAALILTLGNWMDRHTSLTISEHGLDYSNGLIRRQLNWDQIQEVVVYSGQAGSRVVITSDSTRISYRTLVEVLIGGKMKDRYGFEQGKEILAVILEKTGLVEARSSELNTYYYTRE